jgi:hypothetical protein
MAGLQPRSADSILPPHVFHIHLKKTCESNHLHENNGVAAGFSAVRVYGIAMHLARRASLKVAVKT